MDSDCRAAFWSQSARPLTAALGSCPNGLSSAVAAERLRGEGANLVGAADSVSPGRLLLRQFTSPLVVILLVGAAVSLAVGECVDASINLAIVLGSALLSFSQEYRASKAVAALRARLALNARVLRDGAETKVGDRRDLREGRAVGGKRAQARRNPL